MAWEDDELTRFLVTMGLGTMGAPNLAQGLSRGGLFGIQSVDQLKDSKDKRRLVDAKLREEAQQEQQRALALKQSQAWDDAMTRLSGSMGQAPQGSQMPTMQQGDYEMPSGPPMQPQQNMRANPGGSQQAMLQELALRFPAQVKAIFEARKSGESKVYGDPQKDSSGRVFVNTDSGPRYIEGGFAPRDELVESDLGGKKIFRTKYDINPVGYADKTMSPAERDASSRGWSTFNRGDLKEVSDPVTGKKSYAWIGTDKSGAPTVTQTGAAFPNPDMPASIHQSFAQNNVTLSKIDRALDLVDTNPGAFGWKNVAGDWVRQYTDEQGVGPRALVADIGSQKFHDRSGAAVTVSEAPRLKPFIPDVRDRPEAIKTKLQNFKTEYAQMQAELSRGYTINQVAGMTNKNVGSIGTPSVVELEAEARRRGMRP